MIDSLKKTLYAGLGATMVTAEKLESVLQELVDKGKLSAEDARKAVDKVSEESKAEYNEARKSFQDSIDEVLAKAPLVRKKDLEPILKRLDAIEQRLEEQQASGDKG